MIIIDSIEKRPFHGIQYIHPKSGGGIEYSNFPIYRAQATGFPREVDGIIVTSDLQGVVHNGAIESQTRLLGLALAEQLHLLAQSTELPGAEHTGIVLAGDLHIGTDLTRRGGSGDVRPIWRNFASKFRWVVGIAGNHDRFAENIDVSQEFSDSDKIFYLDGNRVCVDDLVFGGVSGIIGNPRKRFRRDEKTYLATVRSVLGTELDLAILHESPEIDKISSPGNVNLRKCLASLPPTLVICGHCNWQHPGLYCLNNGMQVVNVEGRAVWLTSARNYRSS